MWESERKSYTCLGVDIMSSDYIITIDGPNAVGKTEIAQSLARLLNYKHINTGAIYRAVSYVALEKNLSIADKGHILDLINEINIDFHTLSGHEKIIVNGSDVTRELYTAKILSFTSEIAEIAEVRDALLPVQRGLAANGRVVAEGRDTGTTVFPNAAWKFYLDAEDWKKAERVYKLLSEEEKELYHNQEAIIQYIREIDKKDMTRKISPLRKANDAIFYDTTYSPGAEHDAHILWYYMTQTSNIIANSEILMKKPVGMTFFATQHWRYGQRKT